MGKLLKNRFFLFFLGIIGLLLIIGTIVRLITPTTIPENQTTWQGVAPGFSSTAEVVETLGQPQEIVSTNDITTTLKYTSELPAFPHEIVTANDQVSFVLEQIPYRAELFLPEATKSFSEAPDLKELSNSYGPGYRTDVYLSRGIAFVYTFDTKRITQKYYFPIMSEDDFLNSFKNLLENHGDEPENFDRSLFL